MKPTHLLAMVVVWAVSTVIVAAFLGVVGAIAIRVARWFL